MAPEQKARFPADFEFVEGKGIHPFYLGMEVDQVFEAAVGWKIKMIERDPRGASINVHFEVRGKVIEVDLMNTLFAEPNSKSRYQAYYISTNDLQFSDGVRASRMKKDKLISRFIGGSELVRDDALSDDQEEMGSSAYYRSLNGEIFLIISKYEKPSFNISSRVLKKVMA